MINLPIAFILFCFMVCSGRSYHPSNTYRSLQFFARVLAIGVTGDVFLIAAADVDGDFFLDEVVATEAWAKVVGHDFNYLLSYLDKIFRMVKNLTQKTNFCSHETPFYEW